MIELHPEMGYTLVNLSTEMSVSLEVRNIPVPSKYKAQVKKGGRYMGTLNLDDLEDLEKLGFVLEGVVGKVL